MTKFETSGVSSSSGDRWYFTQEALDRDSPSRKSGWNIPKECWYRQQTAYFIQSMGLWLKVSQQCINTAIVYMHRFYGFNSFAHFVWYQLGTAAFLLAAKVEDEPRRMEDVIEASDICRGCYRENVDVNSDKTYLARVKLLVFYEKVLLNILGCENLTIEHPNTHVLRYCQLFKTSKDFTRTAYFLANSSYHLTTLCLQYKPTVVACFCIHLACRLSNWKIPLSNEGKPYTQYVDPNVDAELLKKLTEQFFNIFKSNLPRLGEKEASASAIPSAAAPANGDSLPDLQPIHHHQQPQPQMPQVPPQSPSLHLPPLKNLMGDSSIGIDKLRQVPDKITPIAVKIKEETKQKNKQLPLLISDDADQSRNLVFSKPNDPAIINHLLKEIPASSEPSETKPLEIDSHHHKDEIKVKEKHEYKDENREGKERKLKERDREMKRQQQRAEPILELKQKKNLQPTHHHQLLPLPSARPRAPSISSTIRSLEHQKQQQQMQPPSHLSSSNPQSSQSSSTTQIKVKSSSIATSVPTVQQPSPLVNERNRNSYAPITTSTYAAAPSASGGNLPDLQPTRHHQQLPQVSRKPSIFSPLRNPEPKKNTDSLPTKHVSPLLQLSPSRSKQRTQNYSLPEQRRIPKLKLRRVKDDLWMVVPPSPTGTKSSKSSENDGGGSALPPMQQERPATLKVKIPKEKLNSAYLSQLEQQQQSKKRHRLEQSDEPPAKIVKTPS